jgi:hypothetical protein
MSKRKHNKYRGIVVQLVEVQKEVEVWLPAKATKEEIKNALVKEADKTTVFDNDHGWTEIPYEVESTRAWLRKQPMPNGYNTTSKPETWDVVDSKIETIKDNKPDEPIEGDEPEETDEEREAREEREERDRRERRREKARQREEEKHEKLLQRLRKDNEDSWNQGHKSDDELLDDYYEHLDDSDGEECARRNGCFEDDDD